MSSFKDLNVYQRAYQVAIDLHQFLSSKVNKVIPQSASDLRKLAREILANIADGFYKRTSKAKRFFNFKALDAAHRILLDLEFLHDVKSIPTKEYEHLKDEFEGCAKQLYKFNESILNKEMDSAGLGSPQPAAA